MNYLFLENLFHLNNLKNTLKLIQNVIPQKLVNYMCCAKNISIKLTCGLTYKGNMYIILRPNKSSLITNYDPRQFIDQLDLFGEYGGLGNMRLVRIPKKPLKTVNGGIKL